MKKLILVALFVLIPGIARAQNPTITGIRNEIYFTSNTTAIVATKSYPSSQFVCNLAPPVINTATVNPTIFVWDDPNNVGKVCAITDKALFDSLQPGDYISKAAFLFSDGTTGGTSDPSNPFTRFIGSIPQKLRIVR